MNSRRVMLAALSAMLSLIGANAQASLRCGTELVNLGETIEQVLAKCGPPDDRRIEEPALRSDGLPRLGAVEVQRWIYGPSNGAYRYLRFVDTRLVDIEMKRGP